MLREELERLIRKGKGVSLLLLDIDNFKEINDSFGHQVGDILLRQIGPRLRERLESSGMVGRLGGDEFAVLLPGSDSVTASRLAHGLLRALEPPFLSEDHALEITASIGIASCPEHATRADVLLQRAHVAMYAAKRNAASYAVYRAEEDPYDARRLLLRTDMRGAIERREILLFYQPQVALATGEVTGLEALARWKHAQRGWVPPNEFIPVAERMGLIKPLTAYLVDVALKQVGDWAQAGVSVPVAVDISMRNLLDPRFPQMLEEALSTSSVNAGALKLEITESAVMAEPR